MNAQPKPEPTRRLTDPSFDYVPSYRTDIRKLFDRVRRELERAQRQQKEAA